MARGKIANLLHMINFK